eukprot:6165057-Prymnesium_polylepis.1
MVKGLDVSRLHFVSTWRAVCSSLPRSFGAKNVEPRVARLPQQRLPAGCQLVARLPGCQVASWLPAGCQ